MRTKGVHFHLHNRHAQNVDLTKGSIVKGIIQFALPLFLGLDGVWYTIPAVQAVLGACSLCFLKRAGLS